jgi:hypothetical protein
MSTATAPSTRVTHPRRLTLLVLVPVAAVAVSAGVGFNMLRDDGAASPGRTRAEVIASLDPAARAYVLGIVNLRPTQLAAGFGNVTYTGPADSGAPLHAGRV